MQTGTLNNVFLTEPGSRATITIASGTTFATSGAYDLTLTTTEATNVTLPASGTWRLLRI